MQIKDFLIKTGNYPNLAGFHMLVRAVKIVEGRGRIKLTRLYEKIAEEFNVSPRNVERLIRHVISRISLEQFKKAGLVTRPTNGELIYYFAQGGNK